MGHVLPLTCAPRVKASSTWLHRNPRDLNTIRNTFLLYYVSCAPQRLCVLLDVLDYDLNRLPKVRGDFIPRTTLKLMNMSLHKLQCGVCYQSCAADAISSQDKASTTGAFVGAEDSKEPTCIELYMADTLISILYGWHPRRPSCCAHCNTDQTHASCGAASGNMHLALLFRMPMHRTPFFSR